MVVERLSGLMGKLETQEAGAIAIVLQQEARLRCDFQTNLILLSLCLLLKIQSPGRQQLMRCTPAQCLSSGSTGAKRKRIWPLTSPSYQDSIQDSITSLLTSQKTHGQMKRESRLIGVRYQCASEGGS